MVSALTEQMSVRHRQEQNLIAWRTIQQARRNIGLLDGRNREATRVYADLVIPAVWNARQQSRSTAHRFYTQVRQIETGLREIPTAAEPSEREREEFEARLRSSFGYWVNREHPKRLRRIEDDDGNIPPRKAREARTKLETTILGTVTRSVLDGGRGQIERDVKQDRVAVGWVRVTANDRFVCWFCAMLASRRDYKRTSFDESDPRFKLGGNPLANAKVHDHCRCMLLPMFDEDDVPERTRWYEDQWYKLSDSSDPTGSFRKRWEALMASGDFPG